MKVTNIPEHFEQSTEYAQALEDYKIGTLYYCVGCGEYFDEPNDLDDDENCAGCRERFEEQECGETESMAVAYDCDQDIPKTKTGETS